MKLYNCNVYKFKELIKDKDVVCFGAGQMLEAFLDLYDDIGIVEKIVAVADNDKRKVGQVLSFSNHNIKIIAVNEIKNFDNIVILISCADIATVYMQLNEMDELEETLCCVVNYIKSETNLSTEMERKYPDSLRISKEAIIPKKIHYCWFGNSPIPEANRKWIDSWKRYCPDYEIIEWNETNYDVAKNKYMYEAYQAKKWGFVPDYARLDVIYEHGGIYLDTDVEIIKNMDDLLYQEAFAGVDGTHFISLGLGFGARKGNKLIKALRDEYEKQNFMDEKGNLNLDAAPTLQAPFFKEKGFKRNGEFQVVDGMTIYPEKVLAAKCIWTARVIPLEQSYAIHHYDASWCSSSSKSVKARNIEFYNKYMNSY